MARRYIAMYRDATVGCRLYLVPARIPHVSANVSLRAIEGGAEVLRVAMRPVLTAAATLATAVAVVANPVLPRLPDITIPAMFPASAHGLAAKPVPPAAGASRTPATRVITEIAANLSQPAAVIAVSASTPAMSPPPGREITAALVRAAQASSPPVVAGRTAFRQQAVRVSPANSVTASVGEPVGSAAPLGSAVQALAAPVKPLPLAAVHVPPPPMAAVRVPQVQEDPQAGEVPPATTRPATASPRKRH